MSYINSVFKKSYRLCSSWLCGKLSNPHGTQQLSVLRYAGSKWDKFERRATRKFTPREKKLWTIFIFIARFSLLAVPFNLILWTNFDAYPLQVLVAKAVSYLLSLSGTNIVRADNFIYVREPFLWTIEIIKDCVGWKSFLALSGLIFAVRGVSMRKRLAGIALGAPVIFFGNIFRIYTTIYASVLFGFNVFDTVHDLLWQAGMMALILAIWIAWMKFARERMPQGVGAAAGKIRQEKHVWSITPLRLYHYGKKSQLRYLKIYPHNPNTTYVRCVL